MIASDAVMFTYKGRSATMRVFRNDGYCWGRLNIGLEEYDVESKRDLYDEDDSLATTVFINRALRGHITEAFGWKGC